MLQWPAAAGNASTESNSPMRLREGEHACRRWTWAAGGGGGSEGGCREASEERGARACLCRYYGTMEPRTARRATAPMQHQNSLCRASGGRGAKRAQALAGAGARAAVQVSARWSSTGRGN